MGDRAAAEAGNQAVLVETKRVKLVNMLTADIKDVAQRTQQGFLGLLAMGADTDAVIKAGPRRRGTLTERRLTASAVARFGVGSRRTRPACAPAQQPARLIVICVIADRSRHECGSRRARIRIKLRTA